MRRRPNFFQLTFEPTDTRQFQIIARYQSHSSDFPYDKNVKLTYNKTSGSCDRPPSEIGSQGVTINCSRKDDKVAFQAALNTQAGNAAFKFPAVLTPPPPPTSPSLAEKIADGHKFTVTFADFPGGQSRMGQIYPGVTLTGTYTEGTRTWHVWGPSLGESPAYGDRSFCSKWLYFTRFWNLRPSRA